MNSTLHFSVQSHMHTLGFLLIFSHWLRLALRSPSPIVRVSHCSNDPSRNNLKWLRGVAPSSGFGKTCSGKILTLAICMLQNTIYQNTMYNAWYMYTMHWNTQIQSKEWIHVIHTCFKLYNRCVPLILRCTECPYKDIIYLSILYTLA